MKRVFKVSVIVLILILLFCSCRGLGQESKPNDKRFVSAIGFDEKNGKISVSVEAVEALGEGKVNPYVLKKSGTNVEVIISQIEAESTGELSFAHAEAVVFGEKLSHKNVGEILDYFINKEKIPLSARLVSADDAEELLTFRKSDGKASGYEISDMIERLGEKTGIGEHSTLYEIKTAAMQAVNIFALPILEEDDGSLEFDGMRVFLDNKNSAELDYDESVAYTVIRNIFDGGEIYTDKGVYSVDSAKVKISAELVSDRLQIDILVKSNPDSDELLRIIKEALEERREDYFGISSAIAEQYPELWRNIKEQYNKYFKNAKISIRGES